MQPATTTVQVPGKVNSDVNVRMGPKVTDPKWPSSPLKAGQDVTITGYAIDPDGEDFKLRYQIVIGDQTLWTSAKMITVDPARIHDIPLVTDSSEDPAQALLESLGLKVKAGEKIDLDQAQKLGALLRDFDMQGTWGAQDVQNALDMITHLRSYGVTLGSVVPGRWSLDELTTLTQAVDGIAKGTAGLFQMLFSVADEALAFRVMYAPLHIVRSPLINVNPNPAKGIWYARNMNGYEITFGNRVFFSGSQATVSNPGLNFTSMQLIAHELCHVINWRYHLKQDNGLRLEPEQYYAVFARASAYKLETGETVAFQTFNDGYLFAARSSNDPWETVTDAIANYSLGLLTVNDANAAKKLFGQARQQQVIDLMKRVILCSLQDYKGRAGTTQDILTRGGQTLLNSLTPSLDLLYTNDDSSLDKQIAGLKIPS